MRTTKLSFDLFARQHGNDGLFARFYRHPGSAILLQKQVSKASIAKIVGVSLPPFTALSRQGGYAHTLKGYFYTNLGGTLGAGSASAHLRANPNDARLGVTRGGSDDIGLCSVLVLVGNSSSPYRLGGLSAVSSRNGHQVEQSGP